MGIGNLQNVLRAFGEGDDVSYAQLYFDSSFDPTPRPTRSSPGSATTRPTTTGRCWREGRRCAVAGRPRRAGAAEPAARGKGSSEKVLTRSPRRALRGPGSCARHGTTATSWRSRGAPDHRLQRDARMGDGPPAGPAPGLYAVSSGGIALAMYIGAQVRGLGRAVAGRDLDGPRRGVEQELVKRDPRPPATTRCTPRARRSTSSAATARASRRSLSSPCSIGSGARRHRLGARAGIDPHHGLARGEGAAAMLDRLPG